MDVVSRPVGLRNGQVVGVEIYADGAAAFVTNHRHVHQVGGGEHPPALAVPLETVAYGLAQAGGAGRLLSMLTPATGVLGIPVQGRQQVLLTVGEGHPFDGHVLAMLGRQAVRKPQSQSQRAIVRNAGHAELTSCRLIPAAQHEELIAARLPPVRHS